MSDYLVELEKYLHSRYKGIFVTTERLTSFRYASTIVMVEFRALFKIPYRIEFRIKDEEINHEGYGMFQNVTQKIDSELQEVFKRNLYK